MMYQRTLIEIMGELKAAGKIPPGVYITEIRHDDWCPKLTGGMCCCEPDIWIGGVKVKAGGDKHG